MIIATKPSIIVYPASGEEKLFFSPGLNFIVVNLICDPILFVAKILRIFRKKGTGNRE
jgi:hypothetical protein